MISRRTFFSYTAAAGATAVLSGAAMAKVAEDVCAPFSADMQKATSPDHAIEMLKEGNARFVAGASSKCDLLADVKATSAKQTPFACVLGCIDSRVPPELVFDQQIGDIFTARVAGNFANTDILGSFEFATKVAGAKAIVVLGHTSCGAVKGTIDKPVVGANLTKLFDSIDPAFKATKVGGEQSSKNHELVEAVAEENVRQTVKNLENQSPVLKALVGSGELKIVGALHNIDDGKITFLT